jgi:hypothetical protein
MLDLSCIDLSYPVHSFMIVSLFSLSNSVISCSSSSCFTLLSFIVFCVPLIHHVFTVHSVMCQLDSLHLHWWFLCYILSHLIFLKLHSFFMFHSFMFLLCTHCFHVPFFHAYCFYTSFSTASCRSCGISTSSNPSCLMLHTLNHHSFIDCSLMLNSFLMHHNFILIFFFICFWRTSGSFLIIFSSVAPHRGQPAAKCHPRWQPSRRLAVRCGLGRHRIWTRDCRTTVRRATSEPPCIPNTYLFIHFLFLFLIVSWLMIFFLPI